MTYLWIRHPKKWIHHLFSWIRLRFTSRIHIKWCLIAWNFCRIHFLVDKQLFIYVWRPMLCCCVLRCLVWSCLALSSMASCLIVSCPVLWGLVLFCLVCFSTQTLCTQLLSSWLISLIHQSLGCQNDHAARDRLHRWREHNTPYQQVTPLPRLPLHRHVHAHHHAYILALFSHTIFMDSSQASHRPRHGISKTKPLLFCTGNKFQKMDVWLTFGKCMARHENGICRHGWWTNHDRISCRY